MNVIIGITGGTSSGKTTLSKRIIEELNDPNIAVIKQDSYYCSREDLSFEQRQKINFDHPDALDTPLLISHLRALKQGYTIKVPIYDYASHLRIDSYETISYHKVIIVEGILIFENPELRNLLDVKIFVDTPPDIRILRRINRDMTERGRTLSSIMTQYLNTVRPMHQEFVEPTKKYADIIVPNGGKNTIAVAMIVSRIKAIFNDLPSPTLPKTTILNQ